MNSSLMRWLLDIDSIPRDAEGVRMVLEHPYAGWVWVLIILGSIALAAWSYVRLAALPRGRALLAASRTFLLVLMFLVFAGPMLELPRETVEEDWVLVLMDRSASMSIRDVEEGGTRISRDEQMASILATHRDLFNELDSKREVVWLGFHNGAFSIAAGDGEPVHVGEPTGQRTRLDAAISQALQRAAARPVSGVVLFTDGRTDDPPTRAALRQLQAEQIAVFPVALGSPEPIGDLAVRRVESPRRAYVADKVPIVVELESFGAAMQGKPVIVRLEDQISGRVLDEQVITWDGAEQVLTMMAEPERAGETTWRVVVETEQQDLVPENNDRPFLIDLVDRPLRVLYVEGYPRWEYRYVKNVMVREPSVQSSVMLISADRDFAQEGNAPITRLPRTPEEFEDYDIIVLGDVPATFFSDEQLDMIRDHVARRGAGLLCIGGEVSMPSSYGGTVLSDLLPIRGSLSPTIYSGAVNMQPTELAERLGVLQMATQEGEGWPEELVDPRYRWSQLRWVQRIESSSLKPTAEVLAESVQEVDGTKLPLVMSLRYGAGQVLYAATDEIWRWRFGRGEMLTEQYWIQLIRMLGRESLTTGNDSILLRATPRTLSMGQPLRVEAHVLDASLIDTSRQTIGAVVQTPEGEQLTELTLRLVEGEEDQYSAMFLPDRPGELRILLDDPLLQATSQTQVSPAVAEVFEPQDELRRPETDHDLLQQLARDTGGQVFDVSTLPSITDPESGLPNRAVTTENPLTERIWNTPLVFLLVLFLLATEWVGRKLLRLV